MKGYAGFAPRLGVERLADTVQCFADPCELACRVPERFHSRMNFGELAHRKLEFEQGGREVVNRLVGQGLRIRAGRRARSRPKRGIGHEGIVSIER